MVDRMGIVVRLRVFIYCFVDDLDLVLCEKRGEDNEGCYGHCLCSLSGASPRCVLLALE